MTDEELKYPIGKFAVPVSYTNEDIHNWINVIKTLPGKVRLAIMSLNDKQLDKKIETLLQFFGDLQTPIRVWQSVYRY